MATIVATLGIGIPAVLFAVWPLLRRRGETFERQVADDARVQLETDKRLALRAIRELDQEREIGLLNDEHYADLRGSYEARASAILKQLDQLGPPPPTARRAPRKAAAPPVALTPWTQRPLVLTGGALVILLFGVTLGLLAMRFTTPAPPDPMGSSPGGAPRMTADPAGAAGGVASGGSGAIPAGTLTGMLQAAHASLDAGAYQQAIAAYQAILKREPNNVEAITHLGVILGVAGHTDEALKAFDQALAIDPNYAHAWWDKARVLHDGRQDYAGAIAAWERFIAVGPPGPDRDRAAGWIREAKERLGAPAPPAASTSPAPSPSTSSAP